MRRANSLFGFFVGLVMATSCTVFEADSPTDPSNDSFTWSDRARPISYPGPLFNSDTALDLKSLRLIANLAHAEFDSIRLAVNDSLFVAVAETPYLSQLEGLAQLEAWRSELGTVSYEAFNVHSAYNQDSKSHVSYVFGRWNSTLLGDQYFVFVVAWNDQSKATGVVLWRSPWPNTLSNPLAPARTPEQFHFFSASRLGSDSAAQKAMDFTTAIYRNLLRTQQTMLADTVEYHDGQGKFGYYARAKIIDLLDHRQKDHVHHVLRYTAVIPWRMLRFDRELAAVITYEEWEDKGTRVITVYSFCRLYFFDPKGKIDNLVFTRRLVHPVGRYPLVE